MPRINLLPWREELRKQRQKNFLVASLGTALAGIAVVLGTMFYYSARIEHQRDRNDYLNKEIGVLNEQITEIDELETTKERLIARMNIIENLQTKRPEVVHLFDEIAKSLPAGVHLEKIEQKGTRVTLSGVAQSSTRVSALMRNIDSSPWLTNPDLNVVETRGADDKGRSSTFSIVATQTTPKADTENEDNEE